MLFSTSLIALVAAFPALVSAAPARFYGKRAAADVLVFSECSPFLYTDQSGLNNLTEFADVLEQLESEFYKQALAKFKDSDFTSAGFSSSQVAVEQFTTIQEDESTHSTVLQVRTPYSFFLEFL